MMGLRFRVQLRHIHPPIWRQIEVPPDYSFWDLHVAIQDVMGWEDYHLHEFFLGEPGSDEEIRIGIPDGEGWQEDPLAGWEEPVLRYLLGAAPRSFRYLYDFGDDWLHDVTYEGTVEIPVSADLPRCIGGARACPPEDCGGPASYEEILSGVHELQDAFSDLDPESFDCAGIVFTDPDERWDYAFGEEE